MNNNTPPGVLDNNNLISMIGSLSLEDYDHVTDCARISTMSADKAISRYIDSTIWWEEYCKTLWYFGWQLPPGGEYKIRKRHNLAGTIADHLVKSVETSIGGRHGNAMIDTLDALNSDKIALLSFDKESLRGRRFQVAPTYYDSQGNLHMTLLQLELISRVEKSSFMFWKWDDPSTTLVQRSAFFKLDRHEMVAEKKRQLEVKLRDATAQRFILRKIRQ